MLRLAAIVTAYFLLDHEGQVDYLKLSKALHFSMLSHA